MPISNGTWSEWELINSTTNTTLLDISKYLNSITNDMFWTMILLGILLILIGITSYARTNVSIQISLFVTAILGFLFSAAGLMGIHIPVTIMIAFVGSMVMLKGGD